MTAHELRKMLSEMGLDAKVEFKKKALFPADAPDEQLIQSFVAEPSWERRVCDGLGVPTEAERERQLNAHRHRVNLRLTIAVLIVAVVGVFLTAAGIAVNLVQLRSQQNATPAPTSTVPTSNHRP